MTKVEAIPTTTTDSIHQHAKNYWETSFTRPRATKVAFETLCDVTSW